MSGQKRPRSVRLFVFSFLGGFVVAAGVVVYLLYFRTEAPTSSLTKAEQAYASGLQDLKAGKAKNAGLRFDEATILAEKTLDRLEKERRLEKNNSEEAQDKLLKMAGTAFWLRARAIRDAAFATALSKGKEHQIKETFDSSTGEWFRSFHSIPDAKKREDAVQSLYRSAEILRTDKDIQSEALRLALILDPNAWPKITELAERLAPDDDRATYVLALYNYEQPRPDGGIVEDEKKSPSKMLEARKYLDKIGSDYRLWRTLALEIKVTRWLLREARTEGDTPAVREETQRLERLLFDPSEGALTRAAKFKDLGGQIGTWDFDGVLHVHQVALDYLFQQLRDGPKTDEVVANAFSVVDKVTAFCKAMIDKQTSPRRLERVCLTHLDCLTRIQSLVKDRKDPRWVGWLQSAHEVVDRAKDKNVVSPTPYVGLAGLLTREAHLCKDQADSLALSAKAREWVRTGIEVGEDAEVDSTKLVPLYTLAAEDAVATGDQEEAQTLLKILKSIDSPQAREQYHLLSGVIAERRGLLKEALEHLEWVIVEGQSDHSKMRVHFVLPSVYLALGKPSGALYSLRQAEKAYARLDLLPQVDRKWLAEFLESRDQVRYLGVLANLGTAKETAAEFRRKNPNEPVPFRLIQTRVTQARALAEQIDEESPQYLPAQIQLLDFARAMGEGDKAKTRVETLREEFPHDMGLFRLDVALLLQGREPSQGDALDPALVKQVDAKFATLLKENEAIPPRLAFAQWLAHSDRGEQALSYLDDPNNFPLPRDASHQRTRATILARLGKREELLDAVQALPRDILSDLLYIQLAGSRHDQQERIDEALTRHERKGLFLWMRGELYLRQGEIDRAVDAFLQARDFAHLAQPVEEDLLQAFNSWSQRDPKKLQEKCSALMKASPKDPLPYLGFALAKMQLGAVGQPRDRWPGSRTMAAVLNRWEELSKESGKPPIQASLYKSGCWFLTGRLDPAEREAKQALKVDENNPVALRALIGLALLRPTEERLAAATASLEALARIDPRGLPTLLMKAQLEAARGATEEALQTYRKIAQDFPNQAEGFGGQVSLLKRLGRDRALDRVIQQWRKAQPNSILAARTNVDYLLETGKAAQADTLAEAFVQEQMARLQAQLDAMKRSERVSEEDWKKSQSEQRTQAHLKLLTEMGGAFATAADADRVERWAAKAEAVQPEIIEAKLLRADVALKREQWEEAIRLYEAVLKAVPGQAMAVNNLADLLARHLGEAKRAYEILTPLRYHRANRVPMSGAQLPVSILDTLGLTYLEMDDPKYFPEMQGLFESAANRYPTDPRIHYYLAAVYFELDLDSKGTLHLNRALALVKSTTPSKLSQPERTRLLENLQKLKQQAENSATSN